ncbi:MAG: NADH-quinone oxidoreductase subunit J family protein [Verrucomicrobiales bacterium]
MPSLFFYLFAALSVAGAVALVAFKNPVSSALSMVASFVGLAALFIGLNAYFVGIVQILVYAGAIMVLFLFIIMLLDLKEEKNKAGLKIPALVAGVVLPLLFVVQIYAVLDQSQNESFPALDFKKAAEAQAISVEGKPESRGAISDSLAKKQLPDANLIGKTLFGSRAGSDQGYNFPIQIIGVLLLVSTVGVIVLSKRTTTQKSTPEAPQD